MYKASKAMKSERSVFLKFVGMVFLLFAVFSGIFAGLNYQQDLRQEASVGYGNVEIVLVPSTTPFLTKNLSTIFVRVDTKGEEIDGIQVVFDLLTQTTNDITVRVREGSGLKRAWDRVEGIEGGKKISFAAISSDPYRPFRSKSPIDVAEISFTPKNPGNLAMIFDGFMTKANKHQQLGNVLKPIIIQEYEVRAAPSPSPATSKQTQTSATGSVELSKGGVGGVNTASPIPSQVVSANVTITTGGVGGNTQELDLGSCNDVCTYSSQCGVGFLCYESKCRLSTNLTSSTCQDMSIRNKNCNEACTQASQCRVGLTCHAGFCRSENNPTSETCQNDATTVASVEKYCGQTCKENADCGSSLSCYIGECRLPTNPTNPDCNSKEVITTNLGDDGEANASPLVEPSASKPTLSILTQAVVALGATVIVGFVFIVIYSVFTNKNRNSRDL